MSEINLTVSAPAAIVDLPELLGTAGVLRLRRMEIRGFKSFSDRTTLDFPDGITAVVGPNGCGKSNIGDALNWVLGEQSPKMLRGSSMQDVIFNGSEGRKAQGLAEVTLRMAANNGSGPSAGELAITRKLFRSGESEYWLNGSRARLKDIQEALRNAHVGAKTYATIEQGRIDQILNAKPRERRLIIEDAAGISGFKQKRRLAELKMDATQANLLRVTDIISEVKRQINSLKRQAAKARRYQRLREQLREQERIRFALRARLSDATLKRLRDDEATAADGEAATAAELARLEGDLAAERENVEDADRAFREGAARLHQLESDIERAEERIRLCRERIEDSRASEQRLGQEQQALGQRRDGVQQELREVESQVSSASETTDGLSSRLTETQREVDASAAELSRARESLEQLREQLFGTMKRVTELRNRALAADEALGRNAAHRERVAAERSTTDVACSASEQQGQQLAADLERSCAEVGRLGLEHQNATAGLEQARREQSALGEQLARAREAEQSAAARLRTLEDVATRFAAVSDGVRLLLGAGSELQPRGVVADFVQADREIEAAAEQYLKALLPAVLLDSDRETVHAAGLLRAGEAGRTHILSREQPSGQPMVGSGVAPSAELTGDPRVLGRLRDRLQFDGRTNGFVEHRVGEALVVRDLDSALALHRQHPGFDYLTTDGDVVFASGVVAVGGGDGDDHGLLAHNRKTSETRHRLEEARRQTAAIQASAEQAVEALAEADRRLQAGRDSLEQQRHRLVELELRTRQVDEDRQRTRQRAEVLEAELQTLTVEREGLTAERSRLGVDTATAEGGHARLDGEVKVRVERLGRDEMALAERVEQAAALREELAAHRQRRELADQQRARLQQAVDETGERLDAIGAELTEARRRADEATELLGRTEGELAQHLRDRDRHAEEVAESERAIGERRRGLGQQEESLRGLRTRLEQCRQQSSAAEVARARGESDREHLDESCRQELGVSAGEVLDALEQPLDPETDAEALETTLAEIREKIERVGPVNMMAIDEFSELEERFEFLSKQRADLEQSMDSLKETIRRINRSSRERFHEAFETIRRNYQEIFRVLFNGGRADLRLEEGEDVLECGIEILAQPPGKRLSGVQLMSGGEKAMAAIALLFAIFRHQPSPFCLLDEVDAALDDINVGRFTRMLHEYAHDTQFVIVTHNKLSMEIADLLYGVTMEEPGISRLVSLQLS